MDAICIVSANASRARFFFQAHPAAPLEEINDMVNEAVRLRMAEIGETDKIGPTAATKSKHNVGAATPNKTYEPHQTPDKHQAELFARDIAGFLQQAHQQAQFQHLFLIVSPQFLGILRQLLDPELASIVALEINKDYTQFGGEQLLEQIRSQTAKK